MNEKIKKIFAYLVLSVFIAACSDNTDFSSNPELRLDFSNDTISFDTLFTEIASPTASFLVFNRNSSSLKISNVRLGSGTSSSFRVNVDGQYGENINDLEIRKQDSLFVFVEVILDKNNRDVPFMVSDSLVFTLESGTTQNVHLVAYGRDAIVLKAPVFDSDTAFGDCAYIIYDSLTVAENVSLTLPAGCSLYFHKNAEMKIHGSLLAYGTKERPVVFRGDRTDNLFDYLPYDNVPGQWGGITFYSTSNNNLLDWCDIHSADYGLYVETGDTVVKRLTVKNSKIFNFSNNALEIENACVDVGNSLIANAGGNCVKIVGGRVRFVHCTIANFYVWKQRDVALSIHNTLNGAQAPLREALFANCLITGSKNDEIMGSLYDFGDTIVDVTDYCFVSSLLNTKAVEDNQHFANVIWDSRENSPFAAEHFRLIDNSVYVYDFHLDSLSTARGVALDDFTGLYPVDLGGEIRPKEGADVGCYQYVPIDENKNYSW